MPVRSKIAAFETFWQHKRHSPPEDYPSSTPVYIKVSKTTKAYAKEQYIIDGFN